MITRRWLVAALPLVLAAVALAVPVEKATRPVITLGNAANLKPIGTRDKPVHRIVPGPQAGELAFVGWETPIEIVDDAQFGHKRWIADKRKAIHFAATRDGKRVAWAENARSVVVEETATGKSVTLDVGQHQPQPAFSPDGKLIATGGYGNQLKVWGVDGKLIHTLDAGGKGGLWPLFSPDGKTLAIGNRNHETRLYEVATGKLLHILNRKMTQEIAFSPDGKTLAAAYVDGVVGLWDVATGELRESAASGASEVYSVAWNPTGDLLVSSGLAGKIIVWNPRTMARVAALDAQGWVIQVRFTPDGTRLLSSGADEGTGKQNRKVTIWAVEDGRR